MSYQFSYFVVFFLNDRIRWSFEIEIESVFRVLCRSHTVSLAYFHGLLASSPSSQHPTVIHCLCASMGTRRYTNLLMVMLTISSQLTALPDCSYKWRTFIYIHIYSVAHAMIFTYPPTDDCAYSPENGSNIDIRHTRYK